MNRSFFAPVMTLTLTLVLWSVGQWVFFQKTLNTWEVRSSQVTSQALGRVLEQAHRMNDDLTLQEVIQGLAQSPGVSFACVLDKNNTILAHTEPAKLGHPFQTIVKRLSNQMIWTHSLRDAASPWGSLVIGRSKRSAQLKSAQQAWLSFFGDLFVVMSLLWLLKQWHVLHDQNKERSDALDFRSQELIQEIERLTKYKERSDMLWGSWMQSALEHIHKPVLLLDQTQRLLGCNRAACERSGLPYNQTLRGRSWQDVPLIAGCGDALQCSLEHPGERINTQSNGTPLEFLSEATHESFLTWVYWV